jgi:hypothetical protein
MVLLLYLGMVCLTVSLIDERRMLLIVGWMMHLIRMPLNMIPGKSEILVLLLLLLLLLLMVMRMMVKCRHEILQILRLLLRLSSSILTLTTHLFLLLTM